MTHPTFNIVVLISGNGSNLQAIIDHEKAGAPYHVAAVISNRPNAYGIQRAEQADIPNHVIDHKDFADRDDFDQKLLATIDQYQPDLVVLAGFMRKLGENFVQHYASKLINIHPSLLPKYPGLHTHRKVLENDEPEHGTTVHYVIHELDAGPIIAQEMLDVLPEETEETLKDRIQKLEHELYPRVITDLAAQSQKKSS